METNASVFPALGLQEFGLILVLILATGWSLAWKGIALWKAARNGCKVWYGVLLLINTLGILEILYIFVFSKSKSEVATPSCCSCNR